MPRPSAPLVVVLAAALLGGGVPFLAKQAGFEVPPSQVVVDVSAGTYLSTQRHPPLRATVVRWLRPSDRDHGEVRLALDWRSSANWRLEVLSGPAGTAEIVIEQRGGRRTQYAKGGDDKRLLAVPDTSPIPFFGPERPEPSGTFRGETTIADEGRLVVEKAPCREVAERWPWCVPGATNVERRFELGPDGRPLRYRWLVDGRLYQQVTIEPRAG